MPTAVKGNVTVVIRTSAIYGMSRGPDAATMLRRRAQVVQALAQQYSLQNGSISRGIIIGPVETGGKTIKVRSTNPHTLLVHNGSRAHIIRARNVKYLRFPWRGRIRYAKLVHHPGYVGNPFMAKALNRAADYLS